MKLKYLKHKEIDKLKWDNCISNCFNSVVYAYSWFLDTVCKDWAALVYEDYEVVMPLPVEKRFFIYYIQQPLFTTQLGIFSKKKLNEDLLTNFLKKLPSHFRLFYLNLNTFNHLSYLPSKFSSIEKHTYKLDLIENYLSIKNKYSSNICNLILQAKERKLQVMSIASSHQLLSLFKRNLASNKLKSNYYSTLQLMLRVSLQYRLGEAFGVYNEHNILCAGVIFLRSNGKVYLLISTISKHEKNRATLALLIDQYIERYSENDFVLDFGECTTKEDLDFFSGFGTLACSFLCLKKNTLPKILKKINLLNNLHICL